MPELPPSNLSRVPAGTDVRDLGREINKVIDALNILFSIIRGLCRFTRPNAPPPHFPGRINSNPYRVHGVNGTQATVTGNYSTTTPYLWINVANNTSEWKAITGAWPPDTVILDGRMANCPEEFWVLR